MMNNFKQLQREILDQHLASIHFCERPTGGWIAAIRKSLGMRVHQLAKRLNVSQQAVSKLETNEADGTITLNSLHNAAEAMNCRLVYALIPNAGSLQKTIQNQAQKKAKEIVEPVDQTMMLEAQRVGDVQKKIQQIANELAQNPNAKLWD